MAKKIQPIPPLEENFSLPDSDYSEEEYSDDEQEDDEQEDDEQEDDTQEDYEQHTSEVEDFSRGEPNSQLEASESKSHPLRNLFVVLLITTVLSILSVLLPDSSSDSATSKTITTTYVVQSGDCWSKIARQYNTTVNNLLKLNSELVKDVPRDSSGTPYIYTGWEIKVPDSEQSQTPENSKQKETTNHAETTIYVVQSGDYWAKIARQYGTTVDALLKLNSELVKNAPLDTSGTPYIYTGWEIKVPKI